MLRCRNIYCDRHDKIADSRCNSPSTSYVERCEARRRYDALKYNIRCQSVYGIKTFFKKAHDKYWGRTRRPK